MTSLYFPYTPVRTYRERCTCKKIYAEGLHFSAFILCVLVFIASVFFASMSCGDKGVVHPGRAGLGRQVSLLNDAQGSYTHITCGSLSGSFYLSKYDESKRSHGI